eukprot:CAMPEP_0113479722 /NCGR_PEP_ID=MMETSP0014_2-20120614/21478_1 /TAXON_ID=2857 /ORGANISM="Nitzschia sp." /LENGTH=419 /DNA_ID=CAMNT_0000373073 /DNA_START=314 /DNA_END=1570 /DNA_ORIENTATION=- /assembly_acc=CAM_ASM_000159
MNIQDRGGDTVWQQPFHPMRFPTAANANATTTTTTHDGHNDDSNAGAIEEGNDIDIFDDHDQIISITDEATSTSTGVDEQRLYLQQYNNDDHRHGGFLCSNNITNHTNPDLLGGSGCSDSDFQLATATFFREEPDYYRIDRQQPEAYPCSSTGQHPEPIQSMASFVPTRSSSSSSSNRSNNPASMMTRKVSLLNDDNDNDDTNVQPSSRLVASSSEGISPHLHLQQSHAMLRHQQEENAGQSFAGWNVPCTGDRASQNHIRSSEIDISFVPSPPLNNSRNASNDNNGEKNKKTAGQDSWNRRFLELCQFVKENGHTCVPHGYAKNPRLAQWVKRQRHYYRRKHCLTASKINCKSSSGSASPVSSLTDRRESALNRLGFCWNSHNELWNQRFVDLQKYKEKFGDCNVPINYADNKQLAVW